MGVAGSSCDVVSDTFCAQSRDLLDPSIEPFLIVKPRCGALPVLLLLQDHPRSISSDTIAHINYLNIATQDRLVHLPSIPMVSFGVLLMQSAAYTLQGSPSLSPAIHQASEQPFLSSSCCCCRSCGSWVHCATAPGACICRQLGTAP